MRSFDGTKNQNAAWLSTHRHLNAKQTNHQYTTDLRVFSFVESMISSWISTMALSSFYSETVVFVDNDDAVVDVVGRCE